jgi:hypothetical protein
LNIQDDYFTRMVDNTASKTAEKALENDLTDD